MTPDDSLQTRRTDNVGLFYWAIESEVGLGDRVARAMVRLSHLLRHPPLAAELRFEALPSVLETSVVAVFTRRNCFAAKASEITLLLAEYTGRGDALPGLVVLCPQDHWLRCECLTSNPTAHWGNSLLRLALVYEENHHEAVIWHEALHLLGADDCYAVGPLKTVTHRGPTCGVKRCLMQYDAKLAYRPDRIELCDGNTRRVKAYWAL